MRRKVTVIILLLAISFNITDAKKNNTYKFKALRKQHIDLKSNGDGERIKRALDDNEEIPFWPNRGKKSIPESLLYKMELNNNDIKSLNHLKDIDNDEPFWANRGKRDGTSPVEDYAEYIGNDGDRSKQICKDCLEPLQPPDINLNNDMDPYFPFWGNRGRRDSSGVLDGNTYDYKLFWGARSRRQEKDPFWGNRGRRKTDDTPFLVNGGRQDDDPFWGNRGRRHESEPFWRNRGRRQDSEPFWGNRGRRLDAGSFRENQERKDSDPFWGNRGRRQDLEPFWPSRGKRRNLLKDSILNQLNDINLSRLKRNQRIRKLNYFWINRDRDSKMKYLFNGSIRGRDPITINIPFPLFKTSQSGTVHDSRIYAEQPHYILVDRTSRSSAENDPYVISRGKKYNQYKIKSDRDRRGALAEIVKSVRNDPYYIARGKKDANDDKIENNESFLKAKELVCSAIDLIKAKKESNKVKREINNNDPDRTILKKLADHLQNDPYFVSRGKRNDETVTNDENIANFINDLAKKCN